MNEKSKRSYLKNNSTPCNTMKILWYLVDGGELCVMLTSSLCMKSCGNFFRNPGINKSI